MALVSMTGYGRGSAALAGVEVDVELSSVNRKQFDMRLNLPRGLMALEARIREGVQKRVSRGMVTGNVRISLKEKARAEAVTVNRKLAKAYVKELRSAADDLGLPDDLSLRALLSLPDVLQFHNVAEDTEKVWRPLERAVKQAVTELVRMRHQEGRALAKDIAGRLDKLVRLVAGIRERAPKVRKRHEQQLRKRLERVDAGVGRDDPSLLRELCLFAERSDISEEIVRLESHFAQVEKAQGSREPCGRSLDFLCQEMFREINTIGSKASDTMISRSVIQFKSELECIREQVQNVE